MIVQSVIGVCDSMQDRCRGEFCVWPVLKIVYQSVLGFYSDVAIVVCAVVSATVNDEVRYVLWCSGNKMSNVVAPNVRCMFPSMYGACSMYSYWLSPVKAMCAK